MGIGRLGPPVKLNLVVSQVHELIKRMGLSGRTLSEEELEDAGLALAMSKVDRTKVADRERVMRKLRA